MQNQSVLVTGGAGFIGSELVRQLVERNFRVRVVDNLANGRRENLDGIPQDQVELVIADVRDRDLMASLTRDTDIVFHLASLGSRHSINFPVENHEVNGSATLGLLNAARANGVNRFVHVSSSDVYGTARTTPITEDHRTLPTSVYGASKLAGESYARAFWETYRYPTVILRIFDAYGPRCHHEDGNGEVIPKLMLRCMAGEPMLVPGDGMQTSDFTFVSDMAAGIAAAGLTDDCVGHMINLGSGNQIKIGELAAEVAAVVNRPSAEVSHVEARSGDKSRFFAEIYKAKQLFGFQPGVTLREGLTRLRDWYVSQEASPEQLLGRETRSDWKSRDVA